MKRIIFLTIAFILFHILLHAQLCTGSLGDPTVLIDFGNADAPFPALTPSNISYTLSANNCPGPGEYGLRGRLFNCYNNTWLTTVADHTSGDQDGKYLHINATNHPGTFYATKVDGLCPNTTYEVSVWIANLLRKTACGGNGIKPNITLQVETISGTVLSGYSSGKIYETDALEWKQYGTFFKTSANTTSVALRIINSAGSGECGNVVGIDDIAFKPCGPIVNAAFTKNNSDTISVCDGDTTTFVIKGSYSAGFNNPVLQWQESPDGVNSWKDMPSQNSGNLVIKPKATGFYFYRLGVSESVNGATVGCSRVYSKPITITVNPKPYAQITNYIFGCYGEPVVIFAAGGSQYVWTGPNGYFSSSERPVIDSANYDDEGRYHVRITTYQGCIDTASVNLIVFPAAHVTAISNDVNICEGTSTKLTVSGGTRFKWYPGNFLNNDSIANPVAAPSDSTRFMAVVRNDYDCTDTAYVNVNVWKKPRANAGSDKRTRAGIPVTLEGTVSGTDIRYFWTPTFNIDNANSLRPLVNAPQSAYYTLHTESNRGCGAATDEVFIKVYDKILIPNAFSPNGDGINDVWNIEPLDLFGDADLQVYNRYGQLVFRNIGYIKPWDGTRNGTPMPVGTYYYILDLKIKNEKPLTGRITILR
ncbi:MAG TPA: gliding motility-associated C-terminal domain-containing protein [Chitinophagaceae bacterium]|nr:gliding motility-associated C-terminal domain-containing protein [Chitinophagaceae bacterium]